MPATGPSTSPTPAAAPLPSPEPTAPIRHRRPRPGPPASTSAEDPGRHRPELEGLRALACALVVIYHVWVGRVSGGVDVFFVITGFLLTERAVRAAQRGTLVITAQWRRTLRRLVPTTAVVLVGCAVGSVLVLPESRWPQAIREVVASAFFLQNWRLAADSADYYAAHQTASVVQHLWSLAIQAQFSVLLPVVIVAAALVARQVGGDLRRWVIVGLAGTTLASLVYSIHLTATDQQLAYFHSLTRLWEFTAGALLGLVIARVRLPRAWRVVAGWTGVVALAACGIVLDVAGGFPGYLALWPVLAGCLVLVAERTDSPLGADRWLASPTMQYLGRISFPLYLWHWPVLLLTLHATHQEDVGLLGGSFVVATSLALAAATDRLVDRPLAGLAPGSGHRVAAAATAVVLVVAGGWQAVTLARAAPSGVVGDANHPGALALDPSYVDRSSPDAETIPAAVAAYEDWVTYENDCRRPDPEGRLERCTWVPGATPDAPTIVVAGDSHMQQLLPAVAPIARERGWRVDTLIRPGCPLSTSSDSNIGEVDCIEWNRVALDELTATSPDAVVAQASRNVREGLTEETPPGFVEAWDRLAGAGVQVLAVRDNPRFDSSPPSCVDTYGRGAVECQVARDELYGDDPPITRAVLPPTVDYLDLADWICEPELCRPEVGNVTVYLDDNHLTATYAESLAPVVGPRVAAVVERAPQEPVSGP